MNVLRPEDLMMGFISYIVFLFSTTCHEASHALAAKIGGDSTAALGGQISLNPIPHIRRSPFGMGIFSILEFFSFRRRHDRLGQRAVRPLVGAAASAAIGLDGAGRA